MTLALFINVLIIIIIIIINHFPVMLPTWVYEQRDKLVTLGHASVEWVMGRYLTAVTVLRDKRQK